MPAGGSTVFFEALVDEAEKAPAEPVEAARKAAAREADVAALGRLIERDVRAHIAGPRERRARDERIVAGVEDERGNADRAEPGHAAAPRPIVHDVAESVKRGRDQVVEGPHGADPR